MSIPKTVSEHLERAGLLLQADGELPSVASLVAGEAIRGSWWSHPRAHAIYDVCVTLGEREDLVSVKLLKGKVTHVAGRFGPPSSQSGRHARPGRFAV
jgi:hypothetical protein